ncbi:MAG: flagellar motor stator protein MotA [Sporomusaceae bacterium]|nr:flagellar motor stator protein MotA [Sporomusaceae bacterium]
MELSTVIGMVGGILAVGVGMVLKGASASALINPAAFLIIFAGTAAALCNAFTMDKLKDFPKLMKLLFQKQELMEKSQLLPMFVELSQIARREGILALESRIDEIKDPFMSNAIRMVVDGMDSELIQDVLEAEIHTMQERHRSGALIFSQAGMYAPTLGVLGAVIGLIAALGNLSDIEKLGHSIAAAFVATLLGIFTGYVMWHPFANKLKMISGEEAEMRRMVMEGVLSLQAGDSPIALQAKLMVFIPQAERAALLEKKSEG